MIWHPLSEDKYFNSRRIEITMSHTSIPLFIALWSSFLLLSSVWKLVNWWKELWWIRLIDCETKESDCKEQLSFDKKAQFLTLFTYQPPAVHKFTKQKGKLNYSMIGETNKIDKKKHLGKKGKIKFKETSVKTVTIFSPRPLGEHRRTLKIWWENAKSQRRHMQTRPKHCKIFILQKW